MDKKWKGHPMNTSDIGYSTDFYEPHVITGETTTGPFNPIVTETPKVEED